MTWRERSRNQTSSMKDISQKSQVQVSERMVQSALCYIFQAVFVDEDPKERGLGQTARCSKLSPSLWTTSAFDWFLFLNIGGRRTH